MSKMNCPDEWEERDVIRRLYIPELTKLIGNGNFAPSDDEQHYASTVLRLTTGELVELFDGQGHHCRAEVAVCRKRELLLSIVSDLELATKNQAPVLAVGYCKRFDQVLEKGTELGASKIIPLKLERTAISLGETKKNHFDKIVLAAGRQSGRYYLPEVGAVMTLAELLANYSNIAAALPHGAAMAKLPSLPECILIGPEGGFSPAELKVIQAHKIAAYGLGPHILRVETAAMASLAAYWQVGI